MGQAIEPGDVLHMEEEPSAGATEDDSKALAHLLRHRLLTSNDANSWVTTTEMRAAEPALANLTDQAIKGLAEGNLSQRWKGPRFVLKERPERPAASFGRRPASALITRRHRPALEVATQRLEARDPASGPTFHRIWPHRAGKAVHARRRAAEERQRLGTVKDDFTAGRDRNGNIEGADTKPRQ